MNIKGKKGSLIGVSAVIVLVAAFILTACFGPFGNNRGAEEEEGIEIFTLETGDIIQAISVTGTIDSTTQNNYTMQVSGEILSALEKGDSFKKGDILVEVDNSDTLDQLEQIAMDIEDAESSLRAARINYQSALDSNHVAIQLADLNTEKAEESARSTLVSLETANKGAELSLESSEQALDNAQEILAIAESEGTTSDIQMAQYESSVESAENQIESTRNSSRSSQSSAKSSYEQALISQSTTYWNNLSSLQQAEVQIASTAESIKQAELKVKAAIIELEEAEENLQEYKLLAPYNGMVLSTDFRIGEQAGVSTTTSLISDEFIVNVTVSENDISKISEGNEADITLDAYADMEFSGKIIKIVPISIDDSGVISFEVLIELNTGEDIDIYYGLSASASIVTRKAEGVLYVPIQSVYREGGKSYVDLLISDQADPENISQAIEKVEVTTGINDYLYIEITSGLKEGDIIVTSRIE